MKVIPINDLLINDDKKPQGNPTQFEQLLEEDVYYRNHQSQWEKFEFNFKSLQTQHKPDTDDVDSASSEIRQSRSMPDSGQPITISIRDQQSIKHHPNLSSVINQFNQPEHGKLIRSNKPPETIMTMAKNIEHLDSTLQTYQSHKKIKQIFEFKEYLLFLNGKEAELALNKKGLSQQQIDELIISIKLILKQKHIKLIRITIDGEQQ